MELLIECQDEGVLASILVREGVSVAVGTPLAVLCETELAAEQLRALLPGTSDVYDAAQVAVPVAVWLSYLKSGKAPEGGCM